MKSILGELPITEKQAKKLEIKSRTQMSPMLEKNCLLLSGDESYEKSAQKIKSLRLSSSLCDKFNLYRSAQSLCPLCLCGSFHSLASRTVS